MKINIKLPAAGNADKRACFLPTKKKKAVSGQQVEA